MSHPPPKRFVPVSSEEKTADFNWPPADEELTQFFTKASGSPVPGVDPVLPETRAQKTALDGASPGAWVAEVARLQELIEGLTQKLEWRTKSVGHDPRPKH